MALPFGEGLSSPGRYGSTLGTTGVAGDLRTCPLAVALLPAGRVTAGDAAVVAVVLAAGAKGSAGAGATGAACPGTRPSVTVAGGTGLAAGTGEAAAGALAARGADERVFIRVAKKPPTPAAATHSATVSPMMAFFDMGLSSPANRQQVPYPPILGGDCR
jgi:hypothetical protein